MYRNLILVICVLCAAILIGCSKMETTNSNTAMDNSNKGTTTKTETTTSSADKIGVPECDDYIAKYEACVRSHVPESARAQVESALKTSRESWKKAAETPQGKASLAGICKQALQTAEASMKAYGCNW